MAKLNWRKIVVDGVEYKWRYGRSNAVVIGPDNLKLVFSDQDLRPGWDNEAIEKAYHGKYWAITPEDIAHTIRAFIE